MNKGDPLSIREVANGWVVDGTGLYMHGECRPHSDTHVFRNFTEMSSWIQAHFGVID